MRTFLLFLTMTAVPAGAFGQAAITGSVKDPSGAPMTNVLVEASSPVLIEKTRSSTSDAGGRFRIEDLRPGVYRIRFTSEGWNPVEHEGIALTGSLVATVNAEMTIGAVETAVTVTGASPTVNVYSAKREWTVDGDVIQTL